MKRAFLYFVILTVTAAIAQPFLQISSAADTNVKVRHTVIAATGDAAPDGGSYLPSSFSNIALNARHEVAFDASVEATTGVFVSDGKTTSTVTLAESGSVANPYITPNGEVVFDADFDTFRSNGKSIVPLVRSGDPAPGGGTLSPVGDPRVTNDKGAIAYGAIVSDSTATQGIFRSDGVQTVAIARDDSSVPTGGSFTVLGNTVLNDRGQVAFYSVMTGGTAEFGIFRGEGQELTPVFVSNQIAPGGATFADFGNPIINNHGQIATTAFFTNSTRDTGIFVGDGTNTVTIALQGQPAPKGGIYNGQFLTPTRFNDQGEVAFDARLTGGTSSSGIFRGDGKRTIPIALTGTNAPGTTGTFASFRDFQLQNDGRVAFIATLTPGIGGVNTSNNTGIWMGTSDEDLQLVVRTGDVIDGKVLTRLLQPGQNGQLDLNENSVLWVGSFGTAKAVILSHVLGNE